jgi:hypothetical protein
VTATAPRKIVLAGLGPHARRIYYPLLTRQAAEGRVELAMLIELEDQRAATQEFLRGQQLVPGTVVFLPSDTRTGGQGLARALDRLPLDPEAWGCVISTEPKAHHTYGMWALARGMHVLMDKPISAFDLTACEPESALDLVDEYFQLKQAADQAGLTFVVQTQRRAHLGYELIHEYLQNFVQAFSVPVTFLDIYHADGMWNMPDEYLSRENHPYKYGYGKLMHSGYHFLDLYTWLASVNDALDHSRGQFLDVEMRHSDARDHLGQMSETSFAKLFPDPATETAEEWRRSRASVDRRFGETDVFLLLQTLREDLVVSTASLNLLQTSFSRRAWSALPADTYKGNGRVRHERLTVQVGHLLNLQVHSYQSYEVRDWTKNREGAGEYDHFDISIFRNTALVGGKPHEVIAIGDASQRTGVGSEGYLGHNEAARAELFDDFLNGCGTRSGLAQHELSVKLLAASYYGMLSRRLGRLASPRILLDPLGPGWFEDRRRG